MMKKNFQKKDFIFSIIFSLVVITFVMGLFKIQKREPVIVNTEKIPKINYQYGIPVDSFIVEENKILAGTSFSTLMNELNIKPEITQTIIDKASKIFDLRKIKQGNIFKVFLSKDSSKTVDYLVYEHSATDYLIINCKDTVHVEKRQKKVSTKTSSASGTIESSLWSAVVENGGDPMLALKLSDVYAWSIDFFGLQKGDQFKVFYETELVDDSIIGISKVHAAWFKHMGREYYAIPFYQDSAVNFYDDQGNNIKKAFLKAPLNYSHIASHFTNSRFHPILKIFRPHHGVDYSAPSGTPVQAIGDGTILIAQYSGQGGNYVKIKHNSTFSTGYMHLSRYGQGISPGKHVSQGQIIGYVGSTGLSTGPHLDFRVWKNDQPIDPLKLESPPANPVKKEDLAFFDKIRDIWKAELDNMVVPASNSKNVLAENSKTK